MERIFDRLERILQLWKKLKQTKPNTSEYVALMNQIRALSEECGAYTDAFNDPNESNQVTDPSEVH